MCLAPLELVDETFLPNKRSLRVITPWTIDYFVQKVHCVHAMESFVHCNRRNSRCCTQYTFSQRTSDNQSRDLLSTASLPEACTATGARHCLSVFSLSRSLPLGWRCFCLPISLFLPFLHRFFFPHMRLTLLPLSFSHNPPFSSFLQRVLLYHSPWGTSVCLITTAGFAADPLVCATINHE